MPKLTEHKKLALSGALAMAMGMGIMIGAGASGEGDKPKPNIEPALVAAQGSAHEMDAAKYHAAIQEARAEDETAVDVLSPVVASGAETSTGVMVARGKRASADVEFVGPDAANFETVSVTHADREGGTLVEVKARNTGPTAARMIALIHVSAP